MTAPERLDAWATGKIEPRPRRREIKAWSRELLRELAGLRGAVDGVADNLPELAQERDRLVFERNALRDRVAAAESIAEHWREVAEGRLVEMRQAHVARDIARLDVRDLIAALRTLVAATEGPILSAVELLEQFDKASSARRQSREVVSDV